MTNVALVTGAGRGIGRAIAIALAGAGYDTGLTARSRDDLALTAKLAGGTGTASRRVCWAAGDVTVRADVIRVCDTITRALGPIDLLVNNAGYAGAAVPFLDADQDDWWRVIETNLRGPAHFLGTIVPGMVARGSGRVINISSMQGSKVVGASSAYGVSKAALMRLTDTLAAQSAGSGVTIIDLSPGLVRTAMTANRPDLDALPQQAWNTAEAAADKVVALASGAYDGLHGRFVKLSDDLDDLVQRTAGDADARVLRMR